jgi:subtilisin family serine protease
VGYGVVLVVLLAGTLPSWPIGGAMSAHALPIAQSGKEAVIIEVARGANSDAVARALGVVPEHVFTEVFQGFAVELPAAAIRAAERQGGIVKIWPDLPVHAFAQTIPTGIRRVDADENPVADIDQNGGSINVNVAVLDTGIDRAHHDLDVANGVDCSGKDTGDWNDGNGHGTHVAGTIGARENKIGVVGVAPGAHLRAVKVLDNGGSGRWSDVICGLDWVYAHRGAIDVVNMSLGGSATAADQKPCGGSEPTSPLHRAICRVVNDGDVPVVVAAGNEGKNASKTVPATYDEVITVSAFRDLNGEPGGGGKSRQCGNRGDDTFAGFSNFGQDIDIAAPGACIRSTWPGRRYATLSGTSMAAPHVTGAVALYIASNPTATVADVRAELEGAFSRPNTSPYGFTGADRRREAKLFLICNYD